MKKYKFRKGDIVKIKRGFSLLSENCVGEITKITDNGYYNDRGNYYATELDSDRLGYGVYENEIEFAGSINNPNIVISNEI